MSKVLIRVACLCLASLVLLGGPAAQDGPGEPPHATGLIPLDAGRLDEIVSTWPRVVGVRLNPLGLERVNEVRARKGEPPLGLESAVPVGREVDGSLVRGASALAAAPNPIMAGDLPVKIDNSLLRYFPPIRNQGQLGSCASFASTYVQLSYMTAFQRDLDIRNPGDNTNKYSPKWSYNMLNGGVNEGTYFLENYQLLEKHGAATWAEFPYDSDYRAWCLSASAWRNALNVRTQATQYVSQASSDAGTELIKELLADGYVLVFGTFIDSWISKDISDDPSTSDDDAAVGKLVGYYLSGTAGSHAMTIVGYNDAIWTDINSNGIIDPGEKGAFRIANSWGPGWGGDAGFIWLAYDALNSVSEVYDPPTGARVRAFQDDMVYVLTARDNYAPQMIAEFTVSHAARNQMELSLGRSDTSVEYPTKSWIPAAFQNQGGYFAFDGTTTAVAATFVLDLSDILSAGAGLQRYYLHLADNLSGAPAELSAFKIVDLTTEPPTEAASTFVPQTVDGSGIHPYVDYDFEGQAYNRPPQLSNLRVSPPTGSPGLTFTFSVWYSDPDKDAPTVRNVIIDGALQSMTLVVGEPANGTYSFACTLPAGRHGFYCQFEDGRGGSVRAPLAGEADGPSVYSYSISSLFPNSAITGGPSFVLTVNGTDFPSGSIVTWDGADRPTTFVSSSRVDAAIGADDLVLGREVAIDVRDPAGGYGDTHLFEVRNPAPALASISPWATSGGGDSFEVTLVGSGFISRSAAWYDGAAKPTTYVSATELKATLSTADLDQAGYFQLSVKNPWPGGGTSGSESFRVTDFSVSTHYAKPKTIAAGQSASFTIGVNPDSQFDAPVSLVCDGLPLGSRATFSPPSVTPGNSSVDSQLTISTTARSAALAALSSIAGSIPPATGLALVLALSAIVAAGSSRRAWFLGLIGRRLATVLLILLVLWMAACGAGGGGSEKQGTPAGTYSIKITGRSGSLTSWTTITLTVS